jgi:hypothetical protein
MSSEFAVKALPYKACFFFRWFVLTILPVHFRLGGYIVVFWGPLDLVAAF